MFPDFYVDMNKLDYNNYNSFREFMTDNTDEIINQLTFHLRAVTVFTYACEITIILNKTDAKTDSIEEIEYYLIANSKKVFNLGFLKKKSKKLLIFLQHNWKMVH